MTGLPEGTASSKSVGGSYSDSSINNCPPGITDSKSAAHNKIFLSSLFAPSFAVFDAKIESSSRKKFKEHKHRIDGWASAVRKAITYIPMRSFQDVLGFNRPTLPSSTSEIWLLGVCYKISPDGSLSDANGSDGYTSFLLDFSSIIRMTLKRF